jgi:hypothetical protein
MHTAPSDDYSKHFVMLSKVLQNLANNTLPGKKQKYMEPLDEFVCK